ncbi:MAG: type II secretion system protein [Verrucomicrobiota bacterium]
MLRRSNIIIQIARPNLLMQFLPPNARARRRKDGFSLVEIMIAVSIIGIISLLGYPAFLKVRLSAQNSRFISDIRVFSQAFESYSIETGLWPPNVGAGVVPAGMSSNFRVASWTGATSVGGRWNWDVNNFGFVAAVSVSSPTADSLQMALIDLRIDDGNLNTGLFRQTAPNRYSYILQE